jgi:hypothetical protein
MPLANAPPSPSASEQLRIIERARDIGREYTSSLPNFIARQTTRRQYLAKGAKTWKATDTLIIDVAFVDGKERWTPLTVNGKPTNKTKEQLDGLKMGGEFGGTLISVFNPKSEAKFEWERWATLRGRTVHVVSYRVERERSEMRFRLTTDNRKFYEGTRAFSGLIYIDRDSYQVMRFTHVSDSLPTDWPAASAAGEVDYDFVKIGDAPFPMPLHAESRLAFRDGVQFRSVTDFSNYQRFSSETTIRIVR